MKHYAQPHIVRIQRKVILALAIIILALLVALFHKGDRWEAVDPPAEPTMAAAPIIITPVFEPEEPQEAPEPETPSNPPPAEEPAQEPAVAQHQAFYPLTDKQRDLIERTVAAEARGESLKGQQAVAQTIYHRCIILNQTPEEVLVPGQYASPYDGEITETTKEAVSLIFDDGTMAINEPITAFYAPGRCESAWHETKLQFVIELGGHRFFKEV